MQEDNQAIPQEGRPTPEAGRTTMDPEREQSTEMKPGRGGLVLALGILGIVLCFILGIIAWVMGAGDLREMREGKRHRADEQLTKAGMICGIVGTALGILGFIWMLFVLFAALSTGVLGALGGPYS
ncbi:MAG: hypothetical protein GF400_05585 [Candidatus Eisenbacteria bacterium]|nr:hypothetical protein [Candidatus Eisenbacteria bacterium]